MSIQTKTLSVRVKDKHAAVLRQMAFEVNQVFNLANEITSAAHSNAGAFGPQVPRWLSAFDVQKLTAGIQKERGYTIGSATVQEVIADHGKARKQCKRSRLRWRVSGGARRSLGWIPFKSRAAQWQNGCVKFAGHFLKVWDSYGLSGYTFRAGSFSEDSRGRWYFNICVQVDTAPTTGTTAVGIDLGLKDYATPSEGEALEAGRFYRDLEPALGKAQRAGKKARVRAIHAKIKNRRKDALHKYSTALVNRHAAIFVGDVSSSQLAKTRMAKSVLDAGWAMLKTQLEYKAIARSVVFEVVNERYSTQACSCCGAISDNSPKGRAGLRIRAWTCCECGITHDRDVNAAKNILAAGHCRLAAGIPAL
ncbi:RNA-guided endonuclease InsQ/TnpB family protein [Candidatus Pantoea multigeneris]|uniref:IS200/IS605 family element transposase accessory protein TnpB n=1 Tax=Candidatus Pantoea multigeneris TaxID=2608357 RepID=A0ABX0RDN1_9GAMM|nr:RNA-guided endonuclease TnpB family protein [Pantoea multigeneris]NIF23157.1 IS200/IS605 family element transposase accessory protein TnpB [Pantoea multigeneris]